jgi:hypothetical protein
MASNYENLTALQNAIAAHRKRKERLAAKQNEETLKLFSSILRRPAYHL